MSKTVEYNGAKYKMAEEYGNAEVGDLIYVGGTIFEVEAVSSDYAVIDGEHLPHELYRILIPQETDMDELLEINANLIRRVFELEAGQRGLYAMIERDKSLEDYIDDALGEHYLDIAKEAESYAPENVNSPHSLDDSGEREFLETGAFREPQKDKGRYDLITPHGLRRLAVHYENGAKKYSDRNWEKGIPASRMFSSAVRHLFQWVAGSRNEDHLSAAVWNIMCIIHYEEVMPEMIDTPKK